MIEGPTRASETSQSQFGEGVGDPLWGFRRRGRIARKMTQRPARIRSTPISPTSSADPASPIVRAWSAPETTRAAKRTTAPPTTPTAILTGTQPVNQQGGCSVESSPLRCNWAFRCGGSNQVCLHERPDQRGLGRLWPGSRTELERAEGGPKPSPSAASCPWNELARSRFPGPYRRVDLARATQRTVPFGVPGESQNVPLVPGLSGSCRDARRGIV
jgi:hypothetical protein